MEKIKIEYRLNEVMYLDMREDLVGDLPVSMSDAQPYVTLSTTNFIVGEVEIIPTDVLADKYDRIREAAEIKYGMEEYVIGDIVICTP